MNKTYLLTAAARIYYNKINEAALNVKAEELSGNLARTRLRYDVAKDRVNSELFRECLREAKENAIKKIESEFITLDKKYYELHKS